MDVVTLALAKKFTEETAISFGAVKGAPCRVSRIEESEDGNSIITFEWVNDSGERRESTMTVKKGADGLSIKSLTVNEENHLIIVYSDDTEVDAGFIDPTDKLTSDLIATVSIGTVTEGKKYVKGTTLESILRDMLIKTEKPTIGISISPSKTIYDIVTETLPEVTISANAVKKTYDIKKIEFFVGNTLINTIEEGVTAGGKFDYFYRPATPIKETTTFKVVVTDVEMNTGTSSVTVNFAANSYYGFVEPTVGEPTEAMIKALNKNLKLSKNYVYKNIVCDYNKVVYAYPQSFGALSMISDEVHHFEYTNSFSRTSLKVDGIDYYCYTQTDPSAASGLELTFK